MKKSKFHVWFFIVGTALALLSLFSTSTGSNLFHVAFGADVIHKLSSLPAMVFAVIAIWAGSRALYDYIDLSEVSKKACETPQGAGLVYLAVNIGRVALALMIMGMIATFSS